MNRIVAVLGMMLCSVAALAQLPVPCPSVRWTAGPTVPTFEQRWINGLAIIDYDEDGFLDVVGTVGSDPSRLVWWKAAADHALGAATPIAATADYSNLVVADATGDGRDDLIVASSTYVSSNLLVFPATGSGRGATITAPLPFYTLRIAAVNRDDDSEVEVVAAAGDGHRFSIHDQLGTTMVTIANVSTTHEATRVASADFDGDGDFDVAVGSRSSSALEIHYGNAAGTFDPPVSLPATDPWELHAADVDEDGSMDLIAGSWMNEIARLDSLVSVYRNEGGRSFTRSTFSVDRPDMLQKDGILSMAVADVSGDGHLDLVAIGTSSVSYTATLLGVGDGTFRSPSFLTTAGRLAIADFDDDGTPDLFAQSNYNALTRFSASCLTGITLASVSPMVSVGQDATLRARASGFGTDTPLPRGTITLREGDTILGTADAGADGEATFTLSGLAVGTHLLTAEFSGNAHGGAATSEVLTQRVTTDTTQTTITFPPGPTAYGAPFPIEIKVTGKAFAWVEVTLDGVAFNYFTNGPLNRPLEPGTHTISAKFSGDTWLPPSQSETLQFTIDKATPAILASGPLVVRAGSAHALTFTVQGSGGEKPSGSLQLIEGSTPIASDTLVDGSVSFNLTLARGAHDVRAVYSGDARYFTRTQELALQVLPNQPFFIEARGMTNGVHIAYVVPADTNMASLQLLRRQNAGGWSVVSWNAATGMDTNVSRGIVYEYQLTGSLNGGSPIASNLESALLFSDDLLATGTRVKRKHFTELRDAVNLMRAQAGLTAVEFNADFESSGVIRALHVTALQTALAQARQQLGMVTPAFETVSVGTLIRATQIQQLRELAR